MEQIRITPAQVQTRMDGGEDFLFVDARSPDAWAAATDKLPGALRVPPAEAEQHLAELPVGKSILAYCT